MCGINGIIDFDSRKEFRTEIEKMNSEMLHRGPDSGGVFSE